MEDKKLRLGIIGVGRMGLAHINNCLSGAEPDIDITACADTDPSREAVVRSKLPRAAFFDSADELIGSSLADAVLVATPHYFHPGIAQMAMERGLHVLSEKPAGVYTSQVRAAIETAGRTDLTYALMYNQRTNCVYRFLHDAVRSGRYGRLRRVNWIITDWFRSQAYYDLGSWRATWAGEGGGVLINQSVHQLDLWQWICGMPSSVYAVCREGRWHDIEVEDDAVIFAEYPGGATGTFVTTTGEAPGTNRLEIDLSRAKIVCEGGKISLFELDRDADDCIRSPRDESDGAHSGIVTDAALASGRFVPVSTDGRDTEHIGVVNAFAGHILRGEPLIAGGEEGLNAVEILNGAYLSSWTGRPVALPLDDEEYYFYLRKKIASSRAKTHFSTTDEPFTVTAFK